VQAADAVAPPAPRRQWLMGAGEQVLDLVQTCGFYFLIVPSRSEDLRRTVADRVAQRVAGRGVSRATVDSAVGSVLAALDARGAGTEVRSAQPTLVAAVSARSMPDLASRLRSALARDGVSVGAIGIAAAGLHHVATLEIPDSIRPALERVAAALGGQVSIVSGDGR
jgi:hypothetical protein